MITLFQSGVQIAVDQSFVSVIETGEFVQNIRAGQFSSGVSSEAMRSNRELNETIVIPQESLQRRARLGSCGGFWKS
jgi:hypothetical protein